MERNKEKKITIEIICNRPIKGRKEWAEIKGDTIISNLSF